MARPKSYGDAGDLERESEVYQGHTLPVLPFKAFRVVACVVASDDLRSEPELPAWPTWETPPTTGGGDHDNQAGGPASQGRVDTVKTPEEDDYSQGSATVIAVCHSRSQGVEFVMEGLDRLGLCKRTSGASPWGAMGYEEWKGEGLSDEGRSLLDVLWAGCVCVLGLHGGVTSSQR
jgi:hypothetical protein